MVLTTLDWTIIVAYFLVSLAIGLYYSRRASANVGEYFLSGRDLPWWLAGTSMVATTFAADTPLAVAGFVARNGIAGNWIWWNAALGSMLTVFFFARLWRRAGMRAKLPASTFEFIPRVGSAATDSMGPALALPLAAFFAFVGVQWWASWYPGQEPGGGGYIAQRMMSARDERHSFFATLWFTIAHYCLRPWPWIIVGLASLVLYPGLTDK